MVLVVTQHLSVNLNPRVL